MQYKRLFEIITISILVLGICLFSCSCSARRERTPSGYLGENNMPITKVKVDNSGNGQRKLVEDSSKSGPTTYVPWQDEKSFLDSQLKNNAPVMMAAYHTVLKDPLPGEEENVHLAAKFLAGTVVKPGEVFSQNKKVGPYTQARGYKKGPTYAGPKLVTTIGGGVCKVASTLYNVSVLSNLPVVERYFHSMPVPYVPYGQDATVYYGAKDFKFKNDNDFPILIWAKGVDNILYIAFYGAKKPPLVEWHHEILKTIKAEKIYKLNPSLPSGTEKMVLEGMDGAIVKSWVTIENEDGSIDTKQLRKSYYNQMPFIYEKSK